MQLITLTNDQKVKAMVVGKNDIGMPIISIIWEDGTQLTYDERLTWVKRGYTLEDNVNDILFKGLANDWYIE